MADRVLFISWGTPVRGLEERGLEVFNESLGVFGRMQQDGRIEGFEVMLLDPNTTLGGCMQLLGTADQLAAVREEDEFKRTMIQASLIVEDLTLVAGYVNDGIARQMALYQEAIARLPQRA